MPPTTPKAAPPMFGAFDQPDTEDKVADQLPSLVTFTLKELTDSSKADSSAVSVPLSAPGDRDKGKEKMTEEEEEEDLAKEKACEGDQFSPESTQPAPSSLLLEIEEVSDKDQVPVTLGVVCQQ